MSLLKEGTQVPDFSLPSTPDQKISLLEFHGKKVVLIFYPTDWSPIYGDQLALHNEIFPVFKKYGAEVLAISVDGMWCHLAFGKDRKYRFSLLSDFEPKGDVAKAYGVYRDKDGVCERALFVIDDKEMIRWSHVSPIGVNPCADEILDNLEALSTGKGS
jgi:peroxiredoxin